MTQIPAIVNNHLDCIQISKGGGLLLGASSLTGRYWTGSLWYYKDPSGAPDVERCSAGIEVEPGLNDAKWIKDDRLVIAGLDSGAIQIYELRDESTSFLKVADVVEHDDLIMCLSVSIDSTHAVSASQDKSIKIWDLHQFTSTKTYTAHWDSVLGVDYHPKDNVVFATCSQDGRVLLWDTRKPRPASLIDVKREDGCPTCVAWQPDTDHMLAVGGETGWVLLQDTRKGIGCPQVHRPHTRPVHRLTFCPNSYTWVASVSDDCTAVVTDFAGRDPKAIFRNAQHTDFVRGVSWSSNTQLYTCAWDFKVLKSDLSSTNAAVGDSMPAAQMEAETVKTATPVTMETDSVKNGNVEESVEKMDTLSPKPESISYSEKVKQTPSPIAYHVSLN